MAAQAGVAKSTASLALRDDPRVRPEVRERIQSAAESLGYVRDPALTRLARSRWHGRQQTRDNLVYLTHSPGRVTGGTWFPAAVRKESARLGYHLEEFEFSQQPSGAAFAEMLHHRGVRGVILAPIPSGVAIPAMDWSRLAVVASNEGHADLPFHSVSPDYRHGLRLCWDDLRRQGYSRIGLALLHHEESFKVSAIGGEYLFLQRRHLRRQDQLPMLLGDLARPETGPPALARWIDRHRPDAIIGVNDRVYWDLRALAWPGLEAGAFCSAMTGEVSSHPDIAGATFPREELGALATRLLDGLIRQRETGIPAHPVRHLISAAWVDRPSTVPPLPASGRPSPSASMPGEESDSRAGSVAT